MSSELNLLDAYDRISSNKITERNSGLNDLKLLLTQRRGVGKLNDKGFHKMYENIFRATILEKALYEKQSQSALKNGLGTRLETCGSVLRAGVELGVELLKTKTVKAVYSHIIDTLPVCEELCEPISIDYVKSLRVLFQYPIHTEHLLAEEWETLVVFCCTHVRSQLGLPEEGEMVEALDIQSSHASLAQDDSFASRLQIIPRLTHESEELLMCLRNLLAAPNAHILDNMQIICNTLLGFFRLQPDYTRAHQHAFSSLNLVLNVATANDMTLVRRVSNEIVPVINRFWSTKVSGLKDEMIISLIHCQPYIHEELRLLKNLMLRCNIAQLKEVFLEYHSSSDREVLRLEDVVFPSPVEMLDTNYPFCLRVMSLRQNTQSIHREQTWTILNLIALMVEMLDRSKISGDYAHDSGDPYGSRTKRRRIYDHFEEIMNSVQSGSSFQKLLSLQVISFLADFGGIEDETFSSIIWDLQNACSDNSPVITAWALISIGSCAFLRCASDPSHSEVWGQVWQLCARYATNQSTCQVACHIMRIIISRNLVAYSNISKDVESMLQSIDIHGPASLSDSSLALLSLILRKQSTVVRSSSFHPGERLFQWFTSKWRPVQEGLEKSRALSYAHHTAPVDVINFLLVCCGLEPLSFDSYPQCVCGPIGQACIRNRRYRGLFKMLLNEKEDIDDADTKYPRISVPGSLNTGLQIKIIEFLERQVEYMHEKWQAAASQKQGISGIMMQNFAGFILTSSILCSNFIGHALGHTKRLDIRLRETLLDDLVLYLGGDDCSQQQTDGLFFAVCGFLPKASEMLKSTSTCLKNFEGTAGVLVKTMSYALNGREKLTNSTSESDSWDAMDIDDGFAFLDERNEKNRGRGLLREELEVLCSENAFRMSTLGLLRLCTISLKYLAPADTCREFAAYLMETSKDRLIMMGPVIDDFFSAEGYTCREEDEANFCEHLVVELLQGYDTGRCETALTLCIDTITAFAGKWTSRGQTSDFKDACEDIFGHFIRIGLDKEVTSYTIRNSIARLLERILHHNHHYMEEHPTSALTLFIGLLKDKDIRVSFPLTQRLHLLFEIFSETSHLKLCEDIEAALPSSKDWTEGLAVRAHALKLVASANMSNISRLLYRILEIGEFRNAEQYAVGSLSAVAKTHGFDTQRDLFRLFSAKLIFTWMEYHDLRDFPSTVFGYDNLAEMCRDVPEELAAQLAAKCNYSDAEFVASKNYKNLNELLFKHFAKVVAYCLAWTVGCPPPPEEAGEPAQLSSAVRIRQRIGSSYNELLRQQFPLIISNLYQLIQEDGTFTKFLSSDPNLSEVRDAMTGITLEGFSERKFAEALEPHFKVKVILNAIDYLCTTTGVDKTQLWTPNMVTFVARTLFDTLHPVQGPVHTCTVIRNIRLLICLAGPTALTEYPLQMLIHGLKSYIVDEACAEDTIGILRYLLIKGNEYLSKHPSFVIGTFLSILVSLRKHIQTAFQQDDEKQSIADVILTFSEWLVEHLGKQTFPTLSVRQNKVFKSIVESAAEIRRYGNALKETKESELLRYLLDDDMVKDKLLDGVSRRLAFSLFCSNFTRPENFRDDIFGADKESFGRSRSLLRICRLPDVGEGFLLWSARVLGRAYASTGQLHFEWMQEMEFDRFSEMDPKLSQIDAAPKLKILRRLKALLFSGNKGVTALAEGALSRIVYGKSGRNEDNYGHVLAEGGFTSLELLATRISQNQPRTPMTSYGNPVAPFAIWIRDLTICLCTHVPQISILWNLGSVIQAVDGLAEEIFPYIVHILIAWDIKSPRGIREQLSDILDLTFPYCNETTVQHNKILLKMILYLRSQQTEQEITQASRDDWLKINFLDAARAACTCKMYKTSLLFAEIHSSNPTNEREGIPLNLLSEIYQSIDDLDSFYAASRTSNLQTVKNSFEYEGDGWKSLSFRSANLESGIRLGEDEEDERVGILSALNTLGMNGLSRSFLQSDTFVSNSSWRTDDITYRSAWKLEQWNLPRPTSCDTPSAAVYRALQSVNNTIDLEPVPSHMDPHFLGVMRGVTSATQTGRALGEGMRTLAMLTEMEEVLISKSDVQLDQAWGRMTNRNVWMETGKYTDVEDMMAMRQATFGSLAKRNHLQAQVGVGNMKARYMEAQALVGRCKMARKHAVLQHALSAATQLSKIVQPCKEVGIDISGVATLQAANVLWEDGQAVPSIRMLQVLESDPTSSSQSMGFGRAKLLAKLGNRISEARLEEPDKIMSRYLERAIWELGKKNTGSEVGRVFHEFANFCDQQLQNPNNIEDYNRALKLRNAKEDEVREFEKLIRSSFLKESLTRECNKAKSWLALDDAEYTRLKENREAFLEKSVSNYLKCLSACDDYDSDAFRFTALWLANSSNGKINKAASALDRVPSRKLVPLMNQLSSRLLNNLDEFQTLLLNLTIRICKDHPYHSTYQILALSKMRPKDNASALRQAAAAKVVNHLKNRAWSHNRIQHIDGLTKAYEKLAHAKVDKKKDGKCTLNNIFKDSPDMVGIFERDIPSYRIPPPTMHIDIRSDCNYTKLPQITRYDLVVSLANGLSVPKVIKCEASDGSVYKELVKGGSDDPRQDAIMEQVFEQASVLLQKGRITRQRNLKIRTYKVIPLSATSGIIEFVPDTIPLHDYLVPAHHKYHPTDWKQHQCRKVIHDAQSKSRDIRVAEFQRVLEHYKPAMHYFFMHEFNGPDAWYASRLAYTRSTAAISILGYVLGLGDRHNYNILLDKKTGEVIHIDLGIAFEQGRVLPIPEVVPFRLTRDIVDGMGITKTEGVFRRCSEFTLEVLRKEAYSITTILDVLRYDPLYSWSISPLRMKRMQDSHLEQPTIPGRNVNGSTKLKEESESEADRALTVVAKKLSNSLSVSATVNELIHQATDERNLAVLYSGWGAYL